uniref:Reverse transcriptase domain-containing protein n=1 Tax=Tanacetum cinerariifolium TaxID=118510 RepID=A0A6L2KYF7_TANCI|nr:reverse transcriptase domain-containing protein [Tanacetum cinerariifolium]
MSTMTNTTPIVTTVTKPATNPGREKTSRDADATPRVNIQDFYEEYYEDILLIIMEKIRRDKRKEVHAMLDFREGSRKRRIREGSHYSSARTLSASKGSKTTASVIKGITHLNDLAKLTPQVKPSPDQTRQAPGIVLAIEASLTGGTLLMEIVLRVENAPVASGNYMTTPISPMGPTMNIAIATETAPAAMPTWCHMFNSTLIGAARVWFDELSSESIDNYKELKAAFLAYFMQQRKYVKDPVEIHNIKQMDGETIEDFMERFKVETDCMKGAPECMRISEFMHGVNNLELKKHLNEHVPKTMEEMMITTAAFIRGEVAVAGKKKCHTSWRTHDQSKRHTSENRSDFRGQPREGRGSSRFTPLTRTPKEILAAEAGKFQPPPPMGRDQSKVGKKEAPAKDKPMTIYMIQSWQRMTRQKVTQSFERDREITFPSLATNSGTKGPLVIEAEIGGHMIHRMLLVIIGDADHSTTTWMNFMIVRSLLPYNGIVGRLGIKEIQAIPSTAHEMLKFLGDGGIVTISSTILVPDECAVEVPIGGTLFAEGRTELCSLLKENLDIFAWKPSNMTGVPRSVVEHRLNIREGYSPVRQKKRGQAPKCAKAIQAELANVRRFHGFKQGLSAGLLPLPEINWKVESLCGCPFKCFLDAYKGYHQIQLAESDEEKTAFHTGQGCGLDDQKRDGSDASLLRKPCITGPELKYTPMEKLVLSLVFAAKRLRRYFQAHHVTVITDQPIKQIMSRPDVAGRLQKWSIMLGEHNITYRPRTSVKVQVLADFLVEMLDESPPDASVVETLQDPWTLFKDGSSCVDGSGTGLILSSLEGTEFTYALRFQFAASNNEAEYEALIAGLRIVAHMGVQNVHVSVDSKLVANQVLGAYVAKEENMIKYLEKVKSLVSGFANFSINQLPRRKNKKADDLSNIASTSFAHLSKQVLVEILRKIHIREGGDNSGRGRWTNMDDPNNIIFERDSPRCVGPLQADYVIREIHEGSCSMHAGPRFVVAKAIRLGYYWPTMHRDARDMIRACNDCQIHRKVKILIVAIDYFTKWIEAKVVATITGNQVKKFVWDNIVCRFDLLGEIVSDNGKQFSDNPFKDWCDKLNITQRFSSVKHPQSNRLVKRANRSIREGIKARLGEGNKNWIEELPPVLWAHRIMIKSSYGDTPFSLTYETKAVIPAEIGMPTYRTAAVNVVHNDEEPWLNLDLLKERHERAAIRKAKAKLKMTKYYNARVRDVTFRPGDFVYRSNDASHAVDEGKLGPKWEGPYEVTEALGDGT